MPTLVFPNFIYTCIDVFYICISLHSVVHVIFHVLPQYKENHIVIAIIIIMELNVTRILARIDMLTIVYEEAVWL